MSVTSIDDLTLYGSVVLQWNDSDTKRWISGLNTSIAQHAHNFVGIDGAHLLCLCEEDYFDLDISNDISRRSFSAALCSLYNICYDAENDNLQYLIASLAVLARNFYNDLKRITVEAENKPILISSTKNVGLPSSILLHSARLAEKTRKIICWLDRHPFIDYEYYKSLRHTISTITLDILDSSLNNMNADSGHNAQYLTNLKIWCTQLFTLCDEVIQENQDILMIQNSFLERCDINKRIASEDLGITFKTTTDNIHIVKEVKFQSLADLSGKITVGDEIIEINGQTVIGWTESNVLACLKLINVGRISLLLRKMPRESRTGCKVPATPKPGKTTSKRAKAPKSCAIDSMNENFQHRKRSSSFNILNDQCKPISDRNYKKKWRSVKAPTCPLNSRPKNISSVYNNFESSEKCKRRATVCGGSPTFDRLRLHANRKCSLIPQINDITDTMIEGDTKSGAKKATNNFLATIKDEKSTSSTTSFEYSGTNAEIAAEESEDEVFLTENRSEISLDSSLQSSKERPETDDRFYFDSKKTIKEVCERQSEYLGDENFSQVSTVRNSDCKAMEKLQQADIEDTIQHQNDPIMSQSCDPSIFQNFETPPLYVLRGRVDFEGTTSLPATLPLLSKFSRRKIENFFGENLDDSFHRIYGTDNGSVDSSLSGGAKSVASTSSPKIGWPGRLAKSTGRYSKKSSATVAPHSDKESCHDLSSLCSRNSRSMSRSPNSTLNRIIHSAWPRMKNCSLYNTIKSIDYNACNNPMLIQFCSSFYSDDSDQTGLFTTSSGGGYDANFCSAWLFRYRLPFEEKNFASKWIRTKAFLRHGILHLFTMSEKGCLEPGGVILLNGSQVSPFAGYRKSSKSIFFIKCGNAMFYFGCSDKKDAMIWLNKLGLSSIGYSTSSVDLKGYYFPHLADNIVKH